jgi:hypothetical protein
MEYECIDPELGKELWRLDDPGTAPEQRRILLRHCHHCSACASVRALAETLDQAAQDGALNRLTPPRRPARWSPWATPFGGLAVAASLALIMLLPPSADTMRAPTRAAMPQAEIIRPVTDEVVATSRPTIRWTPLERAREYHVVVTTEAGNELWRTRTEATEARPGRDDGIDAPGRYRIWIEPVPKTLAATGSFGGSFVRGSIWEAARWRMAHAAMWVVSLGVLGLILLSWGVAMALQNRGREAAA